MTLQFKCFNCNNIILDYYIRSSRRYAVRTIDISTIKCYNCQSYITHLIFYTNDFNKRLVYNIDHVCFTNICLNHCYTNYIKDISNLLTLLPKHIITQELELALKLL